MDLFAKNYFNLSKNGFFVNETIVFGDRLTAKRKRSTGASCTEIELLWCARDLKGDFLIPFRAYPRDIHGNETPYVIPSLRNPLTPALHRLLILVTTVLSPRLALFRTPRLRTLD